MPLDAQQEPDGAADARMPLPPTTDSPISDGELMARIASGDELAFGKLIATHGRRLRQLIGRLSAWNADGDDLFQETLLAIWDKANQYDERGSLQSWLTQIVVNRVKNYYRATNRLRRFIERFARHRQAMMSKVESGPDDQVDPDLSQALRLLPQTDRSLIVLYYLDEIPAEQIAAAEKISVETLHVRLHRARKRLKQHLEYLARENESPDGK